MIICLIIEWSVNRMASEYQTRYRKDTEHLYHAFMYSIVILLSGIYPFYAMLSLLVTIICYQCILSTKVFISLTLKAVSTIQIAI